MKKKKGTCFHSIALLFRILEVIHHLSIFQRVLSVVIVMGVHLDIPCWQYLVNHINSVTVNNVVLNATVDSSRFAIFYCTERKTVFYQALLVILVYSHYYQ